MKKSILYIAPAGTSGYAEAAKNYILALSKYHNIQWQPMYYDDSLGNPTLKDVLAEQYIRPLPNPDTLIIHNTADKWQELKNKYNTPSIKKRICVTVWETDRLHPDWVVACNQSWLDEIWVPVKWNKEVFEQSGVTPPIKIVPHIFYEPQHKFPPSDKHLIPTSLFGNTLFYTIGQWNVRKGISETIHAFCQAFTKKDKVALIVKTHWAKYTAEHKQQCATMLQEILQQYPNAPQVHLITNHFSRTEMLQLHKSCHIYVSLCKSEGWGLGAFDAAVTGNPVVITGYGGQTEFLPPNYSYLVDYTLEKVNGMDYISWYSPNQKWAQPDLKNSVEKLQQAHKNTTRVKDRKLSEYVLNRFSEKSIDWESLV